MVKIVSIEEGSLAESSGIAAGDILISVNGNKINDVLDYRFYLTDTSVTLKLLRLDKETEIKIEKAEYEDIGLGFETPLMDKKHACKNACIFCFIDQNPRNMRESVYFKDDDSRLSFIHGNYITLTNMNDEDVNRIIKMRFSPINISVHTTNPRLRVEMMKNPRSGEVLKYMKRFKKAGLMMCGQIVLCRGVNDGRELLRSMRDLSRLFPELSSVSVVPAGLTKFRDKLHPISDFTREEACEIIDMVNAFAEKQKRRRGSRMFYLADEFYLKAGRELPEGDYYEGYPQIENGVGMLRSFTDEFDYAVSEMEEKRSAPRTVSVATGAASYPLISGLARRAESLSKGLHVNVYKIVNNYFGESITVSGLLTGKDIFEQLKGKELGDGLLIPANALRYPECDFLCGMTLDELSEALGVKITATSSADELLSALLGETR